MPDDRVGRRRPAGRARNQIRTSSAQAATVCGGLKAGEAPCSRRSTSAAAHSGRRRPGRGDGRPVAAATVDPVHRTVVGGPAGLGSDHGAREQGDGARRTLCGLHLRHRGNGGAGPLRSPATCAITAARWSSSTHLVEHRRGITPKPAAQEAATTDFGTPGSFPTPPTPPSSGARTGPPWEQPGAFFKRWIDTAKTILLDPQGGFRNVRRSGGLGAPITYYAVGAAPFLTSVLFQLIGLGGLVMGGGDAAGPGLLGGLGPDRLPAGARHRLLRRLLPLHRNRAPRAVPARGRQPWLRGDGAHVRLRLRQRPPIPGPGLRRRHCRHLGLVCGSSVWPTCRTRRRSRRPSRSSRRCSSAAYWCSCRGAR